MKRPVLSAALPRRTVRLRLTAVYVTLFLLSGACLLTITYLLVDQNAAAPVMIRSNAPKIPQGVPVISGSGRQAAPGGRQACVVARTVATPTSGQLTKCVSFLTKATADQRSNYLDVLLGGSAVALGAMTVIAVGIGWVTAGRMLRPVRTITSAARSISASNLHRRLALGGPDDEMKELGDTIDGLLGRLEAAFDAQRQFVANASHELRTPLARQRTLVEVALAEPGPTVEGLRATCERVLVAGAQQERLIEALLTLARSQRGLDRWEPVDLSAVTTEVVQARQCEAADHQLRVEVAVDPGPAVALGDARLAERLVANLVDNAIRHNVAGGWVGVRVEVTGGRAGVRVANSGPAIPPGEVTRLFAPFQRYGAGRGADRRDGHGLGLSIVSAIAVAHGADLRADVLPGGGLAVQLRFPPLPGPALAAASSGRDTAQLDHGLATAAAVR